MLLGILGAAVLNCVDTKHPAQMARNFEALAEVAPIGAIALGVSATVEGIDKLQQKVKEDPQKMEKVNEVKERVRKVSYDPVGYALGRLFD